MIKVYKSQVGNISKEEFDQLILKYKKELQKHAKTIGVPAPYAPPLIRDIVANKGKYVWSDKTPEQEAMEETAAKLALKQKEEQENLLQIRNKFEQEKQKSINSTHKRYKEYRRSEYPSIGDQFDAIMKGFHSLIKVGIQLAPETIAWVDTCMTIKNTFLKPKEK